jgi:hypothetical protein
MSLSMPDTFLGHLDGLELTLEEHAPHASMLLRQHPEIEALVLRLRRVLHELWLSEYSWQSIEVFKPVYELIRETMALHGLALNFSFRASLNSSYIRQESRRSAIIRQSYERQCKTRPQSAT